MNDWWNTRPYPVGVWWTYYSTSTSAIPEATPASDEQVRRIVRQELADLLPIDVPDAPPEDLA